MFLLQPRTDKPGSSEGLSRFQIWWVAAGWKTQKKNSELQVGNHNRMMIILQDINTKLGQATAQNKNKHLSCLSKMEISDVREIFADWRWSVLLSAGFTVQNLDNELRLLSVH